MGVPWNGSVRLRRGSTARIVLALISITLAGCASSTPASTSSAPATAAAPAIATDGSKPASTPMSAATATYPDVPNACAPTAGPGDSHVRFQAAGQVRQALLHVPGRLPAGRVPALIGLHGFSSTSEEFAGYTGLSAKADSAGFVAVYPQALGAPAQWQHPGLEMNNPAAQKSDRDFISEVVDWLAASPCIDAGRIFIVGHSNGGGMTYEVSCAVSGRVAGIGLVSAEYLHDPCSPAKPAPIVIVHAVDDPILPFAGGHINGDPTTPTQLPVETVTAKLASIYGCDATPGKTKIDRGYQIDWSGCAASIRFFRLDSGGHDWSSVTTDRLWDFFSRLP
jgi:polyhydroxybutyrate depolymerase